jgi:hypothetical protein
MLATEVAQGPENVGVPFASLDERRDPETPLPHKPGSTLPSKVEDVYNSARERMTVKEEAERRMAKKMKEKGGYKWDAEKSSTEQCLDGCLYCIVCPLFAICPCLYCP